MNDRNTNLRILGRVRKAIADNESDALAAFKDDFARIHASILVGGDGEEIWQILNSQSTVGAAAMNLSTTNALKFVHSQFDALSTLREQRPLTSEEKHLANEVLHPLLQSIEELMSGSRSRQNHEKDS